MWAIPAVRKLNIRSRLLLICTAVALPLLLMCGFIVWKDYQWQNTAARRAVSIQDGAAVRWLSQWITVEKNELFGLSVLPEFSGKSADELPSLLTTLLKTHRYWHGIALLDLNGKIKSAYPLVMLEKNPDIQALVKSVRDRKSAMLSGYVQCPFTGKHGVLFAVPVLRQSKVEAILLASVDPQAIFNLFAGFGGKDGSVVAVIDANKRVLARTMDNERWVGQDFSRARTVTAASQTASGNIETVGIADDVTRTYAFEHEPETNWLVVVGIPMAAMYGPAHERLLLLLFCSISALGLSVGLAYAATGSFTKPILVLVKESVAIGRGDLRARVSSEAGGELGLLARAFNQMAFKLQLDAEQKQIITKIAESIKQSLDLNEILNRTVVELGTYLECSRCCLAVIEDDLPRVSAGPQLDFNYVWWNEVRKGSPLKNKSVIAVPGSMLKFILDQRSVIWKEIKEDSPPLFEPDVAGVNSDWSAVKSLIACPIVSGANSIGVILVQQCDYRRSWREHELELVEAVARHVGLAAEQGRLYAQARFLAEREALINKIVRAVRSSLDMNQILSSVAVEVGRALNVEYCHIAQPHGEEPLAVTHEYYAYGVESRRGISVLGGNMDFTPDFDSEGAKAPAFGIDFSPFDIEAFRSGTGADLETPVAVVNEVEQDSRVRGFKTYLRVMGTRSFMAAPILSEGRLLGLLMVHSCLKERVWSSSDVRLLGALADQIAVAISHAVLFAQVKQQAITDGLTGLYNHVYFKNRLGEELRLAQRKKTECSLVMLDLDKLKQINDNLGHPVGDAAIKGVASVLKNTLRSGDTAARYGGEEFAVILPETSLPEAILIAERLRRNVSRVNIPGLGNISTSVGVASFPSHSASQEDLVEKADKALYSAKHGGRNRVGMWQEDGPIIVSMEERPVAGVSDR